MFKCDRQRKAYTDQRGRSKTRNIAFAITYEEWCVRWETHLGPAWFKKRGCKSGQYVMARFGDKGSYSLENIKCITANENSWERRHVPASGERNSHARLTELEVIYIRDSGKSITELSAEFPNVALTTITDARNGSNWKHLNQEHPPVLVRRRKR